MVQCEQQKCIIKNCLSSEKRKFVRVSEVYESLTTTLTRITQIVWTFWELRCTGKLKANSARNSQLLRQIDVGTVIILFYRPTSLLVGRYVFNSNKFVYCRRLESEITRTQKPGRHKLKSFILYCTNFRSFPGSSPSPSL